MDEQARTILILFILVALLAAVAVAKVSGSFDTKSKTEILSVENAGSTIIADSSYSTNVSTEEIMGTISFYGYDDSGTETGVVSLNVYDDGSLAEVMNMANTAVKMASYTMMFSIFIMLVGNLITYKLYLKIGMDRNLIVWLIIIPFVDLVLTVLELTVIASVWTIIGGIVQIIITVKFFKLLGMNVKLLWLLLIPVVNIFVGIYFMIVSTSRIGDLFGKSTGFKIGMILLSPIFNGILAFSPNEIPSRENLVRIKGRNID